MARSFGALFPGQGSQSPGMGKFLYENFKLAKELFEEASDLLSLDFKRLCFEDPDQELNLTANTQPALLLVSTCTFKVFHEVSGKTPLAGLGHSIGEYAATVAAGGLQFGDAIRAVRRRGEAMQSAVPLGQGGMMAVIGLTPQQTQKFCKWAESESGFKPLEPANFNAPGQIVVSGNAKAIEWAQQNFNKDIFKPEDVGRAKFIPLKVSAPFHCSLMEPAERVMRQVLGDLQFSPLEFAVIQNFSAQVITDPKIVRENLIRQVSGPVRWIECMQLAQQNHKLMEYIEFGSGKVLAGLAKKINPEFTVHGMTNLEEFKSAEQIFS